MQIESDKVIFNEKPEMKAREITEAAKEALISGKFDMVRVNFANPDMVGHTGDLEASKVVCLPPFPWHSCHLPLLCTSGVLFTPHRRKSRGRGIFYATLYRCTYHDFLVWFGEWWLQKAVSGQSVVLRIARGHVHGRMCWLECGQSCFMYWAASHRDAGPRVGRSVLSACLWQLFVAVE